MHVNNALVDNDQSYINTQDFQQVMFVPHHQWLEEHTALSRINDQLNQAENQQREDWEEISHLQSHIVALEDELFSVKANSFASVAKKVADKPLTGVPAHLSLHSGTGPSSSS
jgi:septal ring factor EnvC (AmiA/AmiB activator)